jgi:hypothetical protein
LAKTNAPLAVLPTFSNNPKEHKLLQQNGALNDKRKQEGGLTDFQTVTHYRNTLSGEVLKRYNALPLIYLYNLIWENVKHSLNRTTEVHQQSHQ